MDYIVEVRDIFRNLILFQEYYDNANTANHVKHMLEEQYRHVDHDQIMIKLIEPEDYYD